MAGIRIGMLLVGALAICYSGTANQDPATKTDKTKFVFQFEELEKQRLKSGRAYLSFLNVDSMHCGVYSLAAGAKDGQQPHAEDEIYVIQAGEAKISIEGQDYDLNPGSVVFVPAKAKHHFHSITKDLQTIVFFSKARPVVKSKKDESIDSN